MINKNETLTNLNKNDKKQIISNKEKVFKNDLNKKTNKPSGCTNINNFTTDNTKKEVKIENILDCSNIDNCKQKNDTIKEKILKKNKKFDLISENFEKKDDKINILDIKKTKYSKSSSICAVICELNPPHNGHKYLFQKAKEVSRCDFVLAIMSGNYVQRGEPAIYSYKERAEMALKIGADAVVLMPTEYSTASGEIFAKAGVMVADAFDNVTHLAFGVEEDGKLIEIAQVIYDNYQDLQELIKNNLVEGVSYNFAKQNAILKILQSQKIQIENLFTPNNMLAIEYLISLFELKSKIKPICIARLKNKNIKSASELRELIINQKTNLISDFIPQEILLDYFKSNILDYKKYHDYACEIIAGSTKEYLKNCRDISEGLENLFYQKINQSANYDEFLKNITSKRYSVKRLKRAILACCLNLSKIENNNIKIDNLKLCAVKKEILPHLKCKINLVTRVNELDFDIENSIDEKSTRLYSRFLIKYEPLNFWTEKIIKK